MKKFSFLQTITKGITFAIPLAIIVYVFFRIIHSLEKVIAPLAKQVNAQDIFGDITVTLIAVICLLIIFLLLGLLMEIAFFAKFRSYIEDRILYFIPSLRHLKLLADDKLQVEKSGDEWKPVLMGENESYYLAFIVEENDEWITFIRMTPPPESTPDELHVMKKNRLTYIEITLKEMRQYNKQFGKGLITLLENNINHKH